MFCRNHDTEIYAFGQRFGEEFDENVLKRAFIQRYITVANFEDDCMGSDFHFIFKVTYFSGYDLTHFFGYKMGWL